MSTLIEVWTYRTHRSVRTRCHEPSHSIVSERGVADLPSPRSDPPGADKVETVGPVVAPVATARSQGAQTVGAVGLPACGACLGLKQDLGAHVATVFFDQALAEPIRGSASVLSIYAPVLATAPLITASPGLGVCRERASEQRGQTTEGQNLETRTS